METYKNANLIYDLVKTPLLFLLYLFNILFRKKAVTRNIPLQEHLSFFLTSIVFSSIFVYFLSLALREELYINFFNIINGFYVFMFLLRH